MGVTIHHPSNARLPAHAELAPSIQIRRYSQTGLHPSFGADAADIVTLVGGRQPSGVYFSCQNSFARWDEPPGLPLYRS
jgi:hypothetical protein